MPSTAFYRTPEDLLRTKQVESLSNKSDKGSDMGSLRSPTLSPIGTIPTAIREPQQVDRIQADPIHHLEHQTPVLIHHQDQDPAMVIQGVPAVADNLQGIQIHLIQILHHT